MNEGAVAMATVTPRIDGTASPIHFTTIAPSGREVGDLTRGAKKGWWRILSYNTTDLTATHALLDTAAI